MGFFNLRQWLNRKSRASQRSASSRAGRSSRKLVLENLESRLAPATYDWTGLGDHKSWNDPNNWVNTLTNLPAVPSGLAANLDNLVFSTSVNVAVPATAYVTNNNLTVPPGQSQVVFGSITVNDPTSPTFIPYVLGGNAITLGSTASSGSGNVTIAAGSGQPLGTAPPGGPIIMSMNITLGGPSGSKQFFTVGNGANLEITGKVSGTTGSIFTKHSTSGQNGTLYLTADNSGFTGQFEIDNNAGIVNIQTATALGSSNSTVVGSGSTLQVQSVAGTIVEPVTLNGIGSANAGALQNVAGANTWSGPITLGSTDVALGALAGALTISGQISDQGSTSALFKEGPGQVIFTVANTYNAQTIIDDGILTIENPLSLGSGSSPQTGTIVNDIPTGQIGGSPAGAVGSLQLLFTGTLAANDPNGIVPNPNLPYNAVTNPYIGFQVRNENLTLNGPGFALGALTNAEGDNNWHGPVILGSAAPNNKAVSIGVAAPPPGASSTLTISSIISDGPAGPAGLTKVDVGELILNNANTYTDTVTVADGILDVRDSGALGKGASAVTVDVGAALNLEVDNGVFDGRPLDADSVTGVNGNGPQLGLTFNRPLVLNGSGVLVPTSVLVFNIATETQSDQTLTPFSGALHSISGINIWGAPTASLPVPIGGGDITLGAGATIDAIGVDPDPNPSPTEAYFTHDYSLTINGSISGGAGTSFAKVGFGQLILAPDWTDPVTAVIRNDNPYLGVTFIDQGWVTIRTDLALGDYQTALSDTVQSPLYVANGAALHLYPFAGQNLNLDKNMVLSGDGISYPSTTFGLIDQKGALMSLGGENTVGNTTVFDPSIGAAGAFTTYTSWIKLVGNTGIGVENPDPAESQSELAITAPIADLTSYTFASGLGSATEDPSILPAYGTSGTVAISYNFPATNDLQVYYPPFGEAGSTLLFDTMPIIGAATVPVAYPGASPVASALFEIDMNKVAQMGGWSYTATITPNNPSGGITKFGSQILDLEGPGTYTGANTVAEGVLLVQNSTGLGEESSGTGAGNEMYMTTNTTVNAGATLQLKAGLANLNGGIAAGVQVDNEHLILNSTGSAAVQTVTLSGTTGNPFTLTYAGQTTAPLTFNTNLPTAAQIQAALLGLPAIGATQTLTLPSATGMFTLAFNGISTGPLSAADPTLAKDMQNDLNALTNIFSVGGGVTVVQSPLNPLVYTITFVGTLGQANPAPLAFVFNGTAEPQAISAGFVNVGQSGNIYTVSFQGRLVTSQNLLTGAGTNVTVTTSAGGLNGGPDAPLVNLSDDNLWNGPVTLAQSSTIDVAPSSRLTLLGVIDDATNLTGQVQTLTLPTVTGAGTFTLTFNGVTTAALNLSSPTLVSDLTNALDGLSTIGGVGASVAVAATTNPLVFTITFGGSLAGMDPPLLTGASKGAANPVITGPGSDLTKLDGGELVLGGANTYRGVTHVGLATAFGDAANEPGGILTIENQQALGATTSGTQVANGSTLQLQGNLTIAGESLTIQGSGLGAPPANVPIQWFNIGPSPENNNDNSTPPAVAPSLVNEPVSGEVTGVATDPTDPNVMYISTAGGGAWKTINDGLTWQQLFDSLPSVQTVTVSGSPSGTFTLTFGGDITGPLPATATAAQVQAALNALPSVSDVTGTTGDMSGSDVSVTQAGTVTALPGGGFTSAVYTVAFQGALAATFMAAPMGTGNFTGGTTATAAIVTSGVTNNGINLAMFTGAIAVAPSDPHVIYLGTGNPDNSANSYYGTGVYRSEDSGQTWTLVANGNTPTGSNPLYGLVVTKIIVDPNDPLLIYVATGDQEVNQPPVTASNPIPIPGVYRFDDTSNSWYDLTGSVTTNRNMLIGQVGFMPQTPGPDDDFRLVFPQGPNSPYAAVPNDGRATQGPATWTDLSLVYVETTDPRAIPAPPPGGLGFLGRTSTFPRRGSPLPGLEPVLYAALGNYNGSVDNAVYRTIDPDPVESGPGAPPIWDIGDPLLSQDEIITLTIPSGAIAFNLTFGGNQTPALGFGVATGTLKTDLTNIVTPVDPGAVLKVTLTVSNVTQQVFTIEFMGTLALTPVALFGVIPPGAVTQAITQVAGGADTETLSEFPNSFSDGVIPIVPRNGNIKIATFVGVNPLAALTGLPLLPTLDQVTVYATIAVPEDFAVPAYFTTAGQLLEIQESIPNPMTVGVPFVVGGGGFDWGTTPGGVGFPAPVATGASFPGTGGTGYMGANTPAGVLAPGLPGPPTSLAMGWTDSALLVDPTNVNILFVGGQETTGATTTTPGVGDIFESMDGGVTWTDISTEGGGGPKAGFHAMAFNAAGELVVGTDGGVWIFNLGTATWDDVNGDLTISLVNSVSPNPTTPGSAVAGFQANGVAVGTGSSAAWVHTDLSALGGVTQVSDLGGGPVAYDPKNANIVYAVSAVDTGIELEGTPFGFEPFAVGDTVLLKSTDGGNTWTTISGTGASPLPIYPGTPLSAVPTNSTVFNALLPSNFLTPYFPILVDPVNDSRLLVGDGPNVEESLDGGTTWNSLGSGLTTITAIAAASFQGTFQADPGFPQVTDLGTNTYVPNTIYAVGLVPNPAPPPPFKPAIQEVMVTKNHGLTWLNRTPIDPTTGKALQNISAIAVDPSNENIAYVVTSSFSGTQIMETMDGGQTWVSVEGSGATGLPDLPIWTVVVDGRNGNVYVGNDNGVWEATGGGSGAATSWQRFGAGLPFVQVTSLVLNPALNTLTAGTFGRGVYQLSLSNVPTSLLTGNTYGALLAASGDSSWNGPIQLVGDPTNNAVAIGTAGTQALADGVSTASLTIFGTISDLVPGSNATLNKVGEGNVILSGANTYGGLTEVKEGQIIVDNSLALGASTLGTNAVQVVSVSGTGTFALTFEGQSTPTTGANVLSATDPTLAADMQTALNALTTIGGVGGAVTVTKTANGYLVYFGGSLAGSQQPLLTSTIVTTPAAVIVNNNTYTTAVQQINFTGPVSTFTLGFNAQPTGPLNYSSTVGAASSTIGATISAIVPSSPGFAGGASESGNIVTIITTTANDLVAGQSVTIGGVNLAGYNGTFVVTSVPTPTTFTYTDATVGLPSTGGGSVTPASTIAAAPGGATELGNVVTITTMQANGLAANQSVTIVNVGVAGYNGTFTVASVTSPTTFTYTDTAFANLANSGGGAVTPAGFGASEAGSTVTILTTTPHDLIVGQSVTIAGVPVAGYNGPFTITAVPTPTSFTYTDTAFLNLANSGGGTVTPGVPGASETSPATIAASPTGASETTATATIAASPGGATETTATATILATPGGASEAGSTVTITTTAASGFAIGETVVIAGVPVTGYDGTFVITAFPTPTSFTYTDLTTGLSPSAGGTATVNTVTITTAAAHGFAIGDTVVIAGVAVGNYNGTFTITAVPTATTFTYTTAQGGLAASGAGTAAVNTVTITTTAAHGFAVGQTVAIGGVGVAGYDGTFTILTVPTATTFTYTTAQTGLAASGGGTAVDNTVTITTTSPHGFTPGEVVNVTGVPVLGYNGTFTILSVPTPTSFTYTDNATALASSGGGTVTLAPVSTAAVIQNALNGLTTIGGLTPVAGSVTVTPSATGYVVVFGGSLADAPQNPLIATTTPVGAGNVTQLVAGGLFGGTIVDAGLTADPVDLGLENDLQGEPVQLNGNGGVFNGHFTGSLDNISNNNTYTGTLVLNASSTIGVNSGTTLTIGTKVPILSGIGTITDNGTTKSLTKELTGTLVLGSANTYGGLTEVNQGVLEVENSLALGGTVNGTDVFNGAQLQLQTPPVQTVTVTGTSGTFTLQFNGLMTAPLAYNASAATVQAALNALTSVTSVGGAAAVTLAGNVYTVTFTGNLGGASQPALIAVGSGGATAVVSATAGVPVVVVGEPLTLAGSGINGTGALLDSGGSNTWQGPITLTPNTVVLLQANGTLTVPPVASSLAPGTVALGVANAGDTLTINGAINELTGISSGTPFDSNTGISKVGPGTLVLQQADSYTGTTYVQQGIVNVQNAGALGSAATPDLQRITVYGPATGSFTLTFDGQTTTAVPSAGPTLDVISAAALASEIQSALNTLLTTLPAPFTNITVTVTPAAPIPNLTNNNFTVSFNSPIDEPPITINLSGNAVGLASVVADGSVGSLVTSGTTLQVQGGITVAEPLTLNGAGLVNNGIPLNNGALENSGGNNSWSGPITLQTDSAIGVDPGLQLIVSGTVQNPITPPTPPVPAPALTKVNTGQLVFTSANTYSGLTLINAGALDVENANALGSSITTSAIAASPTGATEAGNTVTITTMAAHGLIVGEVVVIAGVGVAGYDGAYTVTSILSPTSFTYTDANAPLPASGGGTVTSGMEVQTITVLGASGTFSLTFMGLTTPALNINPTPPLTLTVEIQNALDQLLSNLPSPFQGGSVTVTQGSGSSSNVFTVAFGGLLAYGNMPQLVSNPAAGVLATVATAQDGPAGTLVNPSVNQVVTVTGDTGTFVLTFNGPSTLALPFNATPLQVQTDLNGLSSIGGVGGSVTVTSSTAGVYNVTFGGTLAKTVPPLLTATAAPFTIASLAAGGTGYSVGDVLTLVGGTSSVPGQLTVTSVNTGGIISGFHVTSNGTYTVAPPNPISVTGGTGTGAMFNGSGGATVTVALLGGSSLQIQGNTNVSTESLTLSGPGFNNTGALVSVSGNNGWISASPSAIPLVNTILLADNTTIGSDGGSTLTINQTISDLGQGFSLTKVGTGTVAFTGSTANNYGGLTTVNDGTLQLNKSFGLGASVVLGGSGYKVGNILTLAGGSFTQAEQLTVTAVGNGGVITGVTVTLDGSYTAFPANPVSVTGGSGTGATFNITSLAAGGTGYNVGDVLTIVAPVGTFTQAGQLTVTSVGSGGVITGFSVTDNGAYTVVPTNPVSVTGGAGTGAMFTVVMVQPPAIPGNLVVGDGIPPGPDVVQLEQSNQLIPTAMVTINSDGQFDLNGNSQTIASLTMTGGLVTLKGGQLTLGGNGNVVTATSDSSDNAATINDSVGTGSLILGGTSPSFTVTGPGATTGKPDMTISATITGTQGLLKLGNGTLQLSGTDPYTGGTTIDAGNVQVDGSIGAVNLAGGTLSGTGTVGTTISGTPTSPSTTSVVSPGDGGGPGTLTVQGAVEWNLAPTTFSVDLANAVTYSNLVDNGTANITGTTLAITLGFSPVPSGSPSPDIFTILTSPNPITGTFAQGSVIYAGNVKFDIAYNVVNGANFTVTLERVPINTSTFVTEAPASGVPNTLYDVTATVTPEPGANPASPIPGSIDFVITGPGGAVPFTVAIPSGSTQATLPLQGLPVGTYTVTSATYVSSDPGFIGSTSTTQSNDTPSFTVGQDFTTNVVAATPSTTPSVYGQPLTFTDTVTPSAAGPLLPTGTVSFYADGSTTPIDGAKGTVAVPSVGIITGASVAAGGMNYQVGNVLTLVGGASSPAATLTVTSINALTGAVTGVTVTTPGSYTAFPVPFNPFTVMGGSGSGATFTVTDGVPVSFTTDDLAVTVSPHTITAVYNGDTNYHASNSTDSVSQTVTKNGTTVQITAVPSTNPAAYGTVTITATVTGNMPGVLAPTDGSVTFNIAATYADGSTATITETDLLTPTSGGKVTLQTALTPGSYVIQATYLGDTTSYLASPTATFTAEDPLVISQIGTTTTLNTIPNAGTTSAAFGNVEVEATVAPLASFPSGPTGNVTFTVNGSPVIVPVQASGVNAVAILPPQDLPANASAYSIGATYSGDNNFATSPAASYSLTISKANTGITLTANPTQPVPFGQVVATATVTPTLSPVFAEPTGDVTFTVNSNPVIVPITTTVTAASVASGGSGYQVGDVLTVQGGTDTQAAQLTVSTVGSGGAVTAVTISQAGAYTANPTNPVGVMGGHGTGAMFTLTLASTGQSQLYLVPGGPYSIFANYPGDTNFNSSGPSNTVSAMVTKAISNVTVSSVPDNNLVNGVVYSNSSVETFTIGVQSFLGVMPTGNVTLTEQSGKIAPVPLTLNPATGTVTYSNSSTPLADGNYTFIVSYQGDSNYGAGNSAPYNLEVDTTPPTTPIVTAQPITGSTANFTFSSTDNLTPTADIAYQYNLNNTGYLPLLPAGNNKLTLTGLTQGMPTIQVEAIDLAGNVSTPATFTWNVDTTPPTATINSGPSTPTNNTSATFTFTGTDNLTTPANLLFQDSLDNSPFQPVTSPVTLTSLMNGSHTFEVEAIDQAGNVSTPASYTWVVDTTLPTTTITSPTPAFINNLSPTITFTGSDATSGIKGFQYEVDNGPIIQISASTTSVTIGPLSQGAHSFVVQAIDGAGNISAGASWSFTVDTTPPAVPTITSGPSALTNSTTATFTFTSTDNVTLPANLKFQYSVDNSPFVTGSSPQVVTVVGQGSHTFRVEAIDQAGNISAPASFTWTVDTTAPTITITSGPPALSNSSSATFAFVASEAFNNPGTFTYFYSLNGSAFVKAGFDPLTLPSEGTPPTNLLQGSNTFQVYAVDGAGNQSAPASFTWTVQSTAPTVSIVPINGPQSSPVNSITISFSTAVTGFTESALTLSENGGPNLLTGKESLTTSDGGKTWTLTGLAADNLTIPLNTTFANYTLTLTAKNSGIQDAASNLLTSNATMTFERTEQDSLIGLNPATGQWNLSSNGLAVSTPAGFVWPTGTSTFPPQNVVVGDFTGDGTDDVAGLTSTGQWFVSIPNGSGGYTTTLWAQWAGITWEHVVVGDFTGNGTEDVAAMQPDDGKWWVGVPTLVNGKFTFVTTFWGAWTPDHTGFTWDVVVGDFSGNGKSDIAGFLEQYGDWFVNVSSGSSFQTQLWTVWTPDSTSLTWSDMQVGDFTGDGKMGIAAFIPQSGQWWVNVSSGASFSPQLWTTWYSVTGSVDWVDISVGDFNGDGKADIIGRVKETGQWWVGTSNGSSFQNIHWTTWSAGSPGILDWVDVQIGDYNGDGKSDIVGRDEETGAWYVSLSNGGPTTNFFLNPSLYSVWTPSVNWVDVKTGNFT